jgi:ketosteroid isomerase-like protein
MIEANVQMARRGFEAASAGAFDVIGALLDSDVKWHGGDPSAVGSCQNRGQALEFMRRAYENGRLGELVDGLGAGDKAVLTMRPPPQGGKQSPWVANLATFDGGNVVEMVHYSNPDDAIAFAGIRTRRPAQNLQRR